MVPPRSGRRRIRAAVAVSAALALGGLSVLQTPAAQAATNLALSVTPGSVSTGLQTLTVRVDGGTAYADASSVRVSLPAQFTSPSKVGSIVETADGVWTADVVGSTVEFRSPNPTNNLLNGQYVQVQVQAAVTGPAGATTWTAAAHNNQNLSGPKSGNDVSTVVTVTSSAQSITFPSPGDRTFGDAPFTVSATGGGSGNPVTFTASGVCSSSGDNGSLITLTGAGSCSITADQAAGGGFDAAPSVTRTLAVAKAAQGITFAPIDPQTFGDGPLTLGAIASSGLDVAYVATGKCAVSGTTLTLTGAGSCTVTASQPGNANYEAASPVERTFSIAKDTAVVTLSDLEHPYDGQPHYATATTDPSGLETVSIDYAQTGVPVTAPTRAGSYDVSATLDNPDYTGSATSTLVIAQREVTGSITVADKTYDGTVAAAITGTDPGDIVAGDDVELTCASASFDSADAGTRTATATGCELTGPDAANYDLVGVDTTTAQIDPLSVTGEIQAGDKVYDATTAASVTPLALAGKIGGDDVQIAVVTPPGATFAQSNVGTGITVTAPIELVGTTAGNYVLSSDTASDTAAITVRSVDGAFVADDKVYDGLVVASVGSTSLAEIAGVVPSGPVAGDDVRLAVTDAAFADKSVGVDKPVTGTYALEGTAAANYELANAATLASAADITPLTVTGAFTAHDKVWDGTSAATVATTSVLGAIGGDDVTLVRVTGSSLDFVNGTPTSAVGTWDVRGTFALSGSDAGNYALAAAGLTSSAKASITAKWNLTGFYAPVDMTAPGATKVWNTVKAGSTVPLKFEVFDGVVEQTSLSIITTPTGASVPSVAVTKISCTSGGEDAVESVSNAGATALRYDTTAGQFIQNWKTPAGAGSCYRVTVSTLDASSTPGTAYFKTK